MVIAAHPDDADFGPAATAARWIDEGSVGWLVCCTSGDAGGEDPDARSARAGRAARAGAARAAADRRLRGRDLPPPARRRARNDLALREQLVREIRTFRPDAVLATDPDVIFYRDGGVNHTDHRAAGMAAVDAVYPAARNPMAFPVARPLRPRRRTASAGCTCSGRTSRPSASTSRRRSTARSPRCAAHASQIHEPDKLEERIREWAAEEGAAIGVEAAEALRVVVIEDDEDEGPTGQAAESATGETAAADAG